MPETYSSTIADVRRLKIGHLVIYCKGKRQGGYQCNHQVTIDIEGLPDDLPLSSIESSSVCTHCGAIGFAEVRPDWGDLYGRPPDFSTWGMPARERKPRTSDV